MHQAVVDLFQLLVQAGAVPGEDFSCDAEQQAYRLNERCYELLTAAYPDVDWQDILGTPYDALADRVAALHQQLGCLFVDNLVERMGDRLGNLPENQAAGYVQGILVGVEKATGLALYPVLAARLSLPLTVRLEWLLRQPVGAIPGELCLLDLVMAAGGSAADCMCEQGEVWLSEAGWQRLSQVWDGEATLVPVSGQGLQ